VVAAEAKSKESVDQMAGLLNRGTTFFRHEGKIEEANSAHVNISDDGVLKWIEKETVTDTGETPQGEIKLKQCVRIKSGPRKKGDDMGKDVNLFLVIEFASEKDEKAVDYLELQAGTPEMRDKWVTALRYCVRNMKELGTVSRPKRDLARGNILAAMLTDELTELKEKMKKMKNQLAAAGKPSTKAEPLPAPSTPGGSVVTPAPFATIGSDEKDKEEIKKLRAQVELLKKQNAKLTAQAKKRKTTKKIFTTTTSINFIIRRKEKNIDFRRKKSTIKRTK